MGETKPKSLAPAGVWPTIRPFVNGGAAGMIATCVIQLGYIIKAGVSPILRRQLEELSKRRASDKISSKDGKRPKLVVIGQNCIEPLEALRNSGREVCVSADKRKDIRVLAETWKKKRREGKKHAHEQ